MDGLTAADSLLMLSSVPLPGGVYDIGVDLLAYVLAGLGVGVVSGMFGAGGSAFASPVLALMGVPGRSGNLDRRVARLAVIGGVPGTLIGALTFNLVGGPDCSCSPA